MTYDISDLAFLRNPEPVLERMRADGPFVRARIPFLGKIWMATTDEACRYVLKTPTLFVRDSGSAGGTPMAQRFWWLPPFMKPLLMNMLVYDGAPHARLRGLVDKAFARQGIDAMRPRISQIADDLLAGLPGEGVVDIQALFARPLPLMAICELLGVPDAKRGQIAHWIAPISGPTSRWTMLRALPGLWRTMRYFRKDFETVRRSPRPGLITDLVEVEEAADQLSDDELLAMVVMLFIAGHETTVHLITNALYGLLSNAPARNAMLHNPDELPLLVEEYMRATSPVMMTKPHYVTADTVYKGVKLQQGDQVVALLIGANHDPARFDAPDSFRPNRRPNPHLGFGHGPHVCLGMQLARAETQIALARFFANYPHAQLAEGAPRWSKRTGIHGLLSLPVRLGDRST